MVVGLLSIDHHDLWQRVEPGLTTRTAIEFLS